MLLVSAWSLVDCEWGDGFFSSAMEELDLQDASFLEEEYGFSLDKKNNV